MSSREEVNLALLRLNDAICSLERDGGGEFTLMLIPHDATRDVSVSINGKPFAFEGLINDVGIQSQEDAVQRMVEMAFEERANDAIKRCPMRFNDVDVPCHSLEPESTEPAPVIVSTRAEAETLVGKGSEVVDMADRMGMFNSPRVDIFDATPEAPIDPLQLAAAENLVRDGYTFDEHVPNAIVNGRDANARRFKLTDRQTRVFHAAMVNVSKKTLGERIREARRERKLTLEDTANAMGTTIPHASAVERDNARPTPEQVAALEQLLGVQL